MKDLFIIYLFMSENIHIIELEFDNGRVVGARRVGLSVSEATYLLEFPCTTVCTYSRMCGGHDWLDTLK